jgi:hypothetical protein
MVGMKKIVGQSMAEVIWGGGAELLTIIADLA